MYGRRRGACFRCGKTGHFARECFTPLGGSGQGSSVASPAVSVPAAPAAPLPPKPDLSKTQRWNVPGPDLKVKQRNEDEFRTLLKLLWQTTPMLVKMIFMRFGQNKSLPSTQVDPAFLDHVPIQSDLSLLVELDFQLGRRGEAHISSPDGSKRKEFIINPLDSDTKPELRNHLIDVEDLLLFAGGADVHGFAEGWWHTNGGRLGVPRTLHRLSGISGRQGQLIGVVLRIGRTISGAVERMLPADWRALSDSILLVGPPNSGKTTVLREFARLLSDRDDRVVVVVDKTSEIAGASNEPHPAIGGSTRWVPVDDPKNQYMFMRMAVENLSPDTVVVDELSTESECDSAKTISQRGVQLVATVHGRSMAELVNDKDRSSLLGGVTSVTLSNMEVQQRMASGGAGSKQVMMRKYEPLFGMVIEIHSRDLWYVHRDVKGSVDAYLRREPVIAWRATPGKLEQVVAHPDEDGFRYEPELTGFNFGTASRKPVSMLSKGSDVQVPVAPAVPLLAAPASPAPVFQAAPPVASAPVVALNGASAYAPGQLGLPPWTQTDTASQAWMTPVPDDDPGVLAESSEVALPTRTFHRVKRTVAGGTASQ